MYDDSFFDRLKQNETKKAATPEKRELQLKIFHSNVQSYFLRETRSDRDGLGRDY